MLKIHELKTIQTFFNDIWYSLKEFEVRKNDRNFKVNDLVQLNEYNEAGMCTGKSILIKITYIFDNPEYCKEGFIVFGFRTLDKSSNR